MFSGGNPTMFKEFGRTISSFFEAFMQGTKATRIDERTEPIIVSYPPDGLQTLVLSIGAGELALSPGGADLIHGVAVYNVAEWQPEMTIDGGMLTIKQGAGWAIWPDDLHNRWDFELGTATPYALKVSQGFARGKVNLGGVPLNGLELETGAGECRLNFGAVNPVEMGAFVVRAGAGEFVAEHLLNSRAANYVVECGAGKMTLHFTGETPTRDIRGRLNVGMGEINIVVAAGLSVQVAVSKGIGTVQIGGAFKAVQQEQRTVYETPEYSSTGAPKLIFEVSAGVGAVNLRTE
jgi:hypothetical protein